MANGLPDFFVVQAGAVGPPGTVGAAGADGPAGPAGSPGNGIRFNNDISSNDVTVDPGLGNVRFDTSSFLLITEFSISIADAVGGVSVSGWIADWKAGDVVLHRLRDDPGSFIFLKLVADPVLQAGNQWYRVQATPIAFGGTYPAGALPFFVSRESPSNAGGGGTPDLYAENPVAHTPPSASGNNSFAIGSAAVTFGDDNVALGTGATVGAFTAGVAIGQGTGVAGNGGVAIGPAAAASDASVVLGSAALAGINGVSIGASSSAIGSGVSVGVLASTNSGAVAVGENADGTATGAVAIGNAANAGTGARATAVGIAAVATGADAVALGESASASGAQSVAIGSDAVANATDAIAIGDGASSSGGSSSIAIGGDVTIASGPASIAMSRLASATATNAIAIGNNASASDTDAVALGEGAIASGVQSVAVGSDAGATAAAAVAVGDNAVAGFADAVSIGHGVTAAATEAAVGTSDTNKHVLSSTGGFSIVGSAAQFVLPSYAVAGLPTGVAGGMIYVTDESGGAVPAFFDGTNWRRVTDRAIVS